MHEFFNACPNSTKFLHLSKFKYGVNSKKEYIRETVSLITCMYRISPSHKSAPGRWTNWLCVVIFKLHSFICKSIKIRGGDLTWSMIAYIIPSLKRDFCVLGCYKFFYTRMLLNKNCCYIKDKFHYDACIIHLYI